MNKEGVVQFRMDHRWAALDPRRYGAVAQSVIAWRNRLYRVGLVGLDPDRYEGVDFGNLSGRLPPFA